MDPRSNQRGFGLLETIIALVLTGILMVAVFGVFLGSQRATSRVAQAIENRQNTRTALQLVEHDMRMAGSGWGRINVDGCYKGSPISIYAVRTGYGGALSRSDTIGIMGAWDVSTTLRTALTASVATQSIKVTSATGFATNDLCVVTNGVTAHLFQITSISTNDFNHATSSVYNVAGGHQNWPVAGYPVGTKVYRASWVSYSVDTTSKRRRLVRWQAGWPKQVVANDVTQFLITYRLQGDSLTRNPADMSMVERVEPALFTVVTTPKKASLPDSAWASIKPRSF